MREPLRWAPAFVSSPLGRRFPPGDLARCRQGGGGPGANSDKNTAWFGEPGVCAPEGTASILPRTPPQGSPGRLCPSSPRARRRLSGAGPDPRVGRGTANKTGLVIDGRGVGVILGICFTSSLFPCSDLAGKASIGGGSDLQSQLQ